MEVGHNGKIGTLARLLVEEGSKVESVHVIIHIQCPEAWIVRQMAQLIPKPGDAMQMSVQVNKIGLSF